MARSTEISPATKWLSYAAAGLPEVFTERRPKAIMINTAGNVVMKDASGTEVTFTLPAGVIIPLRPQEIVSTTAAAVIALFD